MREITGGGMEHEDATPNQDASPKKLCNREPLDEPIDRILDHQDGKVYTSRQPRPFAIPESEVFPDTWED